MPIYGPAKTKTMIKSILPSSYREGARSDKARLVRNNRRTNNHKMTAYRGPASYVEDLYDDGERLDYWKTPLHHDYGTIIYDRRGHDKLNHFEMWAYKKTLHLRPEDRYSKMAGVVPNGVIGNHALSHLGFLEYRPGDRLYRYYQQGLPRQLRN